MQDDGTFVIQPGIKGNVQYLIDLLKKKCIDDSKLAKLSKFEGQHYFISIFLDPSGALKGNIKCCCKKSLSWAIFRGKFQLSNFHRYLQDFRNDNTCNTIKERIKIHQLTSSTTKDNQQSFATPNTVLHQGS
ncbi:unnamed protein product, partial [Rotaria sp. Silwood2]